MTETDSPSIVAEAGSPSIVPGTDSASVQRPDSGTAVIEFIFATIILLVPVIYLMLALSQLQAASYATTSTAISASRIAARDANPSERRAHEVSAMHFTDFGLKDVPVGIDYSCAGPCGRAGSLVTARVETQMSLPGFPLLFGAKNSPHITLHATHSDVVAVTGDG